MSIISNPHNIPSSIQFYEICKSLIEKILGEITFIHNFTCTPNKLGLTCGFSWRDFTTAIDILIKDGISSISFILNSKKFKFRVLNGDLISALKYTIILIKGIIFNDGDIAKKIEEISLTEKEYKKINHKKKKNKKKKETREKDNYKFLRVKLGNRRTDYSKFNEGIYI